MTSRLPLARRTDDRLIAIDSHLSGQARSQAAIEPAGSLVAVRARPRILTGQPRTELRAMAEIEFDDITKRYADGFEAVKRLSLDVADGELMILIGPSGLGKSTALRMVAGLEDITDGELKIDNKVV